MIMTIKTENLKSPKSIFILYMLVSSVVIIIFRLIFPGSESPLLIFSKDWRLIHGVLDLFDLFPSLVFSALVIPFAISNIDDNYRSFSEVFFKRLVSSIIPAICAVVVYGAIFLLVFPIVKNYEEGLRLKGELYQMAKRNMQEKSRAGEWQEAAQYLSICDEVWPENPDFDNNRAEIIVNLNKLQSAKNTEKSVSRTALAREWRSVDLSSLPGVRQPLNAAHAISMCETALKEDRFFDAHWLATLAGRLAEDGSPERAQAARLASNAWNKIDSQQPNSREELINSLFRKKLSGYEAMNSGDWIQAFYIFQELTILTPDDPDVARFFAASERGVTEISFFIEEMKVSSGEIITGAVFSLPDQKGRVVLRFSGLTLSGDTAYGTGLEYMKFDDNSTPLANVKASYAKLMPFGENENAKVLILLHALDRNNENNSWDGEWIIGRKTGAGILLNISFEDFLRLSNVRKGLTNLRLNELFRASEKFGFTGYVPEIFEAEILNRLCAVAFFLPMAVFVIILGWRFRAKTKPRYLFIPLLPVLPVIFHGFVFLYRSILNTFSIWLVLSLSFTSALIVLSVILALLLFISLIILSAQHS